jgi:hypothetical protein
MTKHDKPHHKTNKSDTTTRRRQHAPASSAGPSARLRAALADPRCPPVGTTMMRTVTTRAGKTVTCKCKITPTGFLYEGTLYETPTPIATQFAREVVGQAPGSRRSGWAFFRPDQLVPQAKQVGPRAARKAAKNKADEVGGGEDDSKVTESESDGTTTNAETTVAAAVGMVEELP